MREQNYRKPNFMAATTGQPYCVTSPQHPKTLIKLSHVDVCGRFTNGISARRAGEDRGGRRGGGGRGGWGGGVGGGGHVTDSYAARRVRTLPLHALRKCNFLLSTTKT